MDKILVLLSGGQDSTTVLYWAKSQFGEVHALNINYGQRHAREIEAAALVAKMAGVETFETMDLPAILKSTSPLVDKEREVGHYADVSSLPGGVEPTFIPGRNILFLVLAANRATALGIRNIAIGVSQEDYGGYFDCRQDFVEHMESSLNLGIYGKFSGELLVHAPLMHATKKAEVEMALTFPGCMSALAYSHTCYDGEYPPNPRNHASLLRARGFHQANVGDPLIERAIAEGLLPTDYPASGLIEGTVYANVEWNYGPKRGSGDLPPVTESESPLPKKMKRRRDNPAEE